MKEKKSPLSRAEIQKRYRIRKKAEKENLVNTTEGNSLLSLSIIDFFCKVTRLTPTEKQKQLLDGLCNPELMNILISAGRQTGKSLCCAVAAIYLTLKNRVQICLVSAKENYVYSHIVNIFADNPELKQYIAWEGVSHLIPQTGYELKNGSKVLLLSSSEKGIRGASASILFLDEAELMPSETLSTAYGNLSGEKIKLVVLGTPSSHYSKFNEILKNPDKYSFTLFKWSETDCNWHTKEELTNKKKIMTEDEWKRDVLGEISSSDIKLLWEAEQINNCIKDTVLTEGGRREAGIDGGGTGVQNRDKLALVIGERIGKYKFKVLHSQTWGFSNLSEAPKEIGLLLKLYNAQVVKVDSLPSFWSDLIAEHYDAKKVFPVTFKAYKEEMQGKLSHVIESQGLEIPVAHDDLIQEMKSYKKQGNPHYDDLVDALLLANYWNDVLFPTKPATGGRIVIHDMNSGETWGNFDRHSKTGPTANRNFVVTNPNRPLKKGLFSKR